MAAAHQPAGSGEANLLDLAANLARDAKVALLSAPSALFGAVLAARARQVAMAAEPGPGGPPNLRAVGPVGAFERGAFDLVADLDPPPGDLSDRIAGAAALLRPGGILLLGGEARPPAAVLEAWTRIPGGGWALRRGEPGGRGECVPARPGGTKKEEAMSQSPGWRDWPPPGPAPVANPGGRMASGPPPAAPACKPDLKGLPDPDRELRELVSSLEATVGQVHLTAAQALITAGDFARALPHAEASVRFGGGQAQNLNTLGWLRYLERDDAGALQAFDQALALAPNNADIHYNRGMLLYTIGRKDEAEACWEASIRAGNATPEVFNNLGVIRHGRGDAAGAAGWFRRALQADPAYVEARENLAACGSAGR